MAEPERCIHCKGTVLKPLRAVGDKPVCGLCALKRVALLPLFGTALIEEATKRRLKWTE